MLLALCCRAATASLFGYPANHRIVLTDEQLEAYERDGVVLVKGVLRGRQLRRMQHSAKHLVASTAPILKEYRLISFQGWRNNAMLRSVALDGAVPDLVAQAMRLQQHERLRVLKDAMLAFQPGNVGCGWHVDDKFFWPCLDSAAHDEPRLEGVNVWITLSPLTAAEGGGLAVVPGSARAPWREKARRVIAGAVGGGTGPPATCAMADLAPAIHRRFERTKRLDDMQPGDALIHSRYCFHRGEPFAHGDTKLRYSIRYMPASARLFDNHFEAALRAKGLRGGEPLDACGEFYPQVWPRPVLRERLLLRLGRVTQERIPKAPAPRS